MEGQPSASSSDSDSGAEEAAATVGNVGMPPRLLRAARPPDRAHHCFDDEFSAKPLQIQRGAERDGLHRIGPRRRALAPTFGERGGPRFVHGTTRGGGGGGRRYGVDRWLGGCRDMRARRSRAAADFAAAQHLVALGYYQHLVLKRWRRAAALARALRRLVSRCGVGLGFAAWRAWLAEADRLALLGRRFAALLRRWFPAGRALARWRENAARVARESALARVARRRLGRSLAPVFARWRAALAGLRDATRRLERAAALWNRASSLGGAWYDWKRRTLAAAAFARAVAHWRRGALGAAWYAWDSARRAARAAALRDNRAATAALTALLERSAARGLRVAWSAWRAFAAAEESPPAAAAAAPDGASAPAPAAAAPKAAAAAARAPRPPRQRPDPRRGRLGHCRCVYYGVERRGCDAANHLEWRVAALRRNVDDALRSGDGAVPPPSRRCERPSRPLAAPPGRFHGILLDAGLPDPLAAWDEARAASAAAAAAVTATARVVARAPTVALMSGPARKRRTPPARAHGMSRW